MDVIGVTRNYADIEVDRAVRDANMNLMRSVARDFKGGVNNLKSYGFKGYKLNELTPNKTRRAQLVNWLIFYRETLYGKSFEQLFAERETKELNKKEQSDASTSAGDRMYQRKRLDNNNADISPNQ